MRFGCCASYRDADFVREIGYDFIELAGKEIAALDAQAFREAEAIVRESGLFCKGFNAYCDPSVTIVGEGYDNTRTREYAKFICERGAQLGIESVGIGSPASRKVKPGFSVEEARKQAVEFVATTAEEAAPYGICVLWESLNEGVCLYGVDTAEALRVLDGVKMDNVGLVLDFHHMHQMNLPAEEVMPAAPYIRHAHFSRTGDNKRGFLIEEQFPIYQAWADLAKRLAYNGTLSVEPEGGDIRQGAEQSLGLMKEAFSK